jgi:hypothetical protein
VIHGHGLEVVDQVPIIASEESERTRYMAAKRDRMGHILPAVPADPAGHEPGQNGPSRH